MTYEFTIDRLCEAPRELVFDTLFDPAAQEEIFAEGAPEGYRLPDASRTAAEISRSAPVVEEGR